MAYSNKFQDAPGGVGDVVRQGQFRQPRDGSAAPGGGNEHLVGGAMAVAMAGLHSPSMLFAITRPMGPAMIWALPAFQITAFSPVAPALAPALSMAAVAAALVPTAITSPA